MQTLTFFKRSSNNLKAETQNLLQRLPRQQADATRQELPEDFDSAIFALQTLAGKVTHLLEFVSLNMAALRKILKKFKKHVEPLAPMPGFLALEVGSPSSLNALFQSSLMLLSYPVFNGKASLLKTLCSSTSSCACLYIYIHRSSRKRILQLYSHSPPALHCR